MPAWVYSISAGTGEGDGRSRPSSQRSTRHLRPSRNALLHRSLIGVSCRLQVGVKVLHTPYYTLSLQRELQQVDYICKDRPGSRGSAR